MEHMGKLKYENKETWMSPVSIPFLPPNVSHVDDDENVDPEIEG